MSPGWEHYRRERVENWGCLTLFGIGAHVVEEKDSYGGGKILRYTATTPAVRIGGIVERLCR